MHQKKKFDNELVNTLIGEGTTIKGLLHTQRSLRVDGHIEGEIKAQGDVFIGEKSHIKANIVAKHVVVAGQVTGNIEAVSGLHITKTGKVYGDITGDQLLIEEGGIYRGKVNMDVISAQNPYEGSFKLAK